MSPPPPPPGQASLYEFVLREDPLGYEDMRIKMEEWYPSLSLIATTSIGTVVGTHGPEAMMTPNQITRAFLATKGLNREGLAARMIAAKHTNRWRYACAELIKYLGDASTAGHGAAGRGGEAGHPQADGFRSSYDRNKLTYWALHYYMSYVHDATDEPLFEPLRLYQDMCSDSCAYRVPVPEAVWKSQGTYEEKPAYGDKVECRDLGPLVSYGSLRQLQSRVGVECENAADFPEDHALQLYCSGDATTRRPVPAKALFVLDHKRRRGAAPFKYRQDVLCNPTVDDLSIEDVVGNPAPQTRSLYDSTGAYGAQLDSLEVPAAERGESDFGGHYAARSLMRFVYVTSSHDPAYPPGVYRLMDGPFFADVKCSKLPDQVCGQTVTTTTETVPDPGDYVPSDSNVPYNSQWERRSPFPSAAVKQYDFLDGGGRARGYAYASRGGQGRRLATVTKNTRTDVRVNHGALDISSAVTHHRAAHRATNARPPI